LFIKKSFSNHFNILFKKDKYNRKSNVFIEKNINVAVNIFNIIIFELQYKAGHTSKLYND
jgi:hypothetical protein